jgi:hypothetical protein
MISRSYPVTRSSMKTSDSTLQSSNHEQPARVASGWMGLVVNVALYAAAPLLIFVGARSHVPLLMFGGGGGAHRRGGVVLRFFHAATERRDGPDSLWGLQRNGA